jgi:hypothetical protein
MHLCRTLLLGRQYLQSAAAAAAASAADDDHKDELSALISANPSLLLPAYEAALRGLGSADGEGADDDAAQYAAAIISAFCIAFQHPTLQQLQLNQQQQQKVLQQLYALQVTCLKLQLQRAGSSPDTVFVIASGVIATCTAVLAEVAQDSNSNSGSNSSSNRCVASSGLDVLGEGVGVSTAAAAAAAAECIHVETAAAVAVEPAVAAAAAPWVALLARCIAVLVDVQLAVLLKVGDRLFNVLAVLPLDAEDGASPSSCIDHAAGCISVLSAFLSAAGLSADVQQQLEQEAAAVRQQLVGLQQQRLQQQQGLGSSPRLADQQAAAAAAAAAESGASAAGASSTLQQLPTADGMDAGLQQLRSFAQAVAGRLPLSSACNSPGCTNLAQRSELVLVGGKSCVCARCKAARGGGWAPSYGVAPHKLSHHVGSIWCACDRPCT